MNRAQSVVTGVETFCFPSFPRRSPRAPGSTASPPGVALTGLRAARCFGLFLIVPVVEPCSADFQSAVSPNCIRQNVVQHRTASNLTRLADCKSAIRRKAAEPQPKQRGCVRRTSRSVSPTERVGTIPTSCVFEPLRLGFATAAVPGFAQRASIFADTDRMQFYAMQR